MCTEHYQYYIIFLQDIEVRRLRERLRTKLISCPVAVKLLVSVECICRMHQGEETQQNVCHVTRDNFPFVKDLFFHLCNCQLSLSLQGKLVKAVKAL